ncbi:TetR/AcrR family transcriptional regulator [Agromyces bauzanensis]
MVDPQAPGSRPGSPRSGAATRERIRLAARERFARDGFERTTIRQVAGDAGVDPALVMRYFGSKPQLFADAAQLDIRLPRLADVPRDRLGVVLARHFLDRWEADDTLQAILRAATTHPEAAERMRDIFAGQLLPVARELSTDPGEAATRAALAASQVLGVALTRYVLRFPAIARLGHDELVAWIAPTLQRYLTGDLD